MALVFATDANNDLYISPKGGMALATGIVATMQAAQQAVETMAGEMIYAVDQGMPNFQVIWSGPPNLPQFEASLRATILAVANVTGIESLTVTAAGNKVSYAATIQTIYGPGVLNG